MSTIKFVPMEFFAQFALTQMRRLQAWGAVGGRGSLSAGAGRCLYGFSGAGCLL